jgi:fused signal recognition particle receptor
MLSLEKEKTSAPPKAAEFLLGELKVKLSKEGPLDSDSVKNILRENIQSLLVEHKVVQQKNMLSLEKEKTSAPQVILVVGVNGAGKTTSVGKLAHYFSTRGKSVLVVAADTFRAAAEKQLDTWAQRASVSYYTSPQTKDPAAVAFQGVEMAVKDKKDVIIVDTAGRLHNKEHLMEELKKVKRVIQKVISSAPHETLLVIDANNGQNAINQAKEFHSALGVTGLIVTKLDGTAKGGVVIGMAQEVGLIPVYVGVGEGIEDLEDFSPERFASALMGQGLAQGS